MTRRRDPGTVLAWANKHGAGWTLRRIGEAYGVDHSTVRNVLRRAGVDTSWRGRDDEAATKTKRTNKARKLRGQAADRALRLAGALRSIGRDDEADKIEAYARNILRVSL